MGKIYARKIKDGAITLADVPSRWVEDTRKAYFELYGEEI